MSGCSSPPATVCNSPCGRRVEHVIHAGEGGWGGGVGVGGVRGSSYLFVSSVPNRMVAKQGLCLGGYHCLLRPGSSSLWWDGAK